MAIPPHIQAQLDAADAISPPRGIMGGPVDPNLLATVREAVYGQWPPVAASPRPAAFLPAAPTRPGAAAPGSYVTIDPTRARATVAASRAILGPGGSATRAQPFTGRTPSGVDSRSIYARRREQAAVAGAEMQEADARSSGPIAPQSRPRLPDAASVYAARRGRSGERS